MHVVLVWALFFMSANNPHPIYFGTQADCVSAKSAIEGGSNKNMSPCIRMKIAVIDGQPS